MATRRVTSTSPDLFDLPVHPAAAFFPMMPDDEIADLGASIKLNGQRDPIILGEWLDETGKTITGIIDGRNRIRACRLVGVEPKFEQLNGADPRALIFDKNVVRRNVGKGQQAMSWAMIYPEPEKGGRGKKGVGATGFSRERLSHARTVLHEAPDLAPLVLSGKPLDEAYAETLKRRKAVESEEAQIARLKTEAPDLYELFCKGKAAGGLGLAEAIAALDQRIKEAAAAESNKRETMLRLGEAAYRGNLAWASDEFAEEVRERVADEKFRRQLIDRLQLDKLQIAGISRGARAFAKLLDAIAEDLS